MVWFYVVDKRLIFLAGPSNSTRGGPAGVKKGGEANVDGHGRVKGNFKLLFNLWMRISVYAIPFFRAEGDIGSYPSRSWFTVL